VFGGGEGGKGSVRVEMSLLALDIHVTIRQAALR